MVVLMYEMSFLVLLVNYVIFFAISIYVIVRKGVEDIFGVVDEDLLPFELKFLYVIH
jgi:hypothetical protein